MANQTNSIFKPLNGLTMLLPLVCAFNTLTFLFSTDKSGWKGWKALELMRRMIALAFEIAFVTAHFLWEHLPSHVPFYTSLKETQLVGVIPINEKEESSYIHLTQSSDNATGRALSQVLELVNDTPASSEKYEFARALADKIIRQNLAQAEKASRDANRVALAVAFSRTLKLLHFAILEAQRQHVAKGYSWSRSFVRSIFFRGVFASSHIFSLENLYSCVCSFLLSLAKAGRFSPDFPSIRSTTSAGTTSNGALPEKLAQELLWITERLKACSAVDEAIRKWAMQSRLAHLSLSAHPRVQASLLRVSVLLLKELAGEAGSVSKGLKTNILLLWLPLFCHTKSGFDGPIFTASEKSEIIGVLEQNIFSLPNFEQEITLACWLREYVSSSSEWPNLQLCYERWCFATRKSGYVSH